MRRRGRATGTAEAVWEGCSLPWPPPHPRIRLARRTMTATTYPLSTCELGIRHSAAPVRSFGGGGHARFVAKYLWSTTARRRVRFALLPA